MPQEQTPFVDLPAALVEEILQQTEKIAKNLLDTFQKNREQREELRRKLIDSGMIVADSSLDYLPLPTTCGIDGSYALERLLTTDIVAAAAVAVEGLTPPSEKRHWEQPRHQTFIAAEPHLEDTATVLRAVMVGEELLLAEKAPHDVVMLDGTLTLPIIYFNQALNKAPLVNLRCADKFLERCQHYLEAYLKILNSERSDKNFIALPKYSTRREIGRKFEWPSVYDDRGMLTHLLNPGELTSPVELEQPEQEWHLSLNLLPSPLKAKIENIAEGIVSALKRVRIFYYKPHDWLPALRVEIAEAISLNNHRLALAVHALKHQCATPSMLEPYPIYLADRTVKALARALPAFRQVTTQRISEDYMGDIGEIFFAMHGYRSETGR